MIYLKKFDSHASYETEINGGGVDISLPNVSYCEDVKDVHYTPYNLVRFYVGNITGTTPQNVKIYTDSNTSVDVQVSENNKWYTYVLPKDKGLYMIEGDSVKKVVVKADINGGDTIIPFSTVEASFKGSDTSNVTSMDYMFSDCNSLKSLDLSGWDTSNVTNMDSMFQECNSLTSLDVSGFDTSNVTDMKYMFYGCIGLTSLNLRRFNTSNVTRMEWMFMACSGLESLDLNGWNTSNVTNMGYMFSGCTSLTSLDLSGWDTSKVTNMDSMFSGCTNSLEIIMKGCSKETIDNIKAQLTKDGITGFNIIQ